MSDDCISRQAVLDFFKDDVYVCNEVMNMPSVTPQPKTGHWIPVSERLPEKDELYLVYFDDGEYELAYFSNGVFSYSGVVAWMPLPEPYKEVSE